MRFSGVKAIFFDLDNTLVDHNKAERHAIQSIFSELHSDNLANGIDVVRFVEAYRHINERLWADMAFNRITPDDLKRERFVQTIRAVAPTMPAQIAQTLGERLGARYMEEYHKGWRLIAHANEAIEHASKLARIGIVSNGFTDQQTGKLQRFGWQTRFEAVILSSDAGVMKPHKEIFDKALEALNVKPSEALYVGDNYASDIEGSANAGWRTVWLNPQRIQKPENRADWTIASLAELLCLSV